MELVLERKWKKSDYTIGILLIDNKKFCEVIEDKDRGLKDSMTTEQIKLIKKPNMTAIPTGTYDVTLDVFSSKFGNIPFYKKVCNGKLPRLLNVKGFEGILIHCGNTQLDTSGCLIVGENKVKGKVINSKITFEKLYNILKNSKDKITIKII
jgi:hypothetical protein